MSVDRKAALQRGKAAALAASSPTAGASVAERVMKLGSAFQDEKVGLLSQPSTSTGDTEIEISWAKLKDNPYNARTFYRHSKILERAESIKERGQLEAAKVVPDPDEPGCYIIIDGGYRKRALMLLGKPGMLCKVGASIESKLELYALSRAFNKEREDNSMLDDIFAWKRLLDDGVLPNEDALAKHLSTQDRSMTTPNLHKYLKVAELPEKMLGFISDNPEKFGVRMTYAVYQYYKDSSEAAASQLLEKIVFEDLPVKTVEGLREKLGTAKQRSRLTSRPWNILDSNGTEIGKLKEFDDSGRIVCDLVVLDPDQRRQVMAKLKEALAIPVQS